MTIVVPRLAAVWLLLMGLLASCANDPVTPQPFLVEEEQDEGEQVEEAYDGPFGDFTPSVFPAPNADASLEPPSGEYSDISVGIRSCGIHIQGHIVCWGGFVSQTYEPPSSGEYKDIDSSIMHTCGLKNDDTISCWGEDAYGYTLHPLGEFKSISYSCGIRLDNTAECWGTNDYGQAEPPGQEFMQVSSGDNHACGIRSNGTIACWGDNEYGQTDSPSGMFTSIAVGGLHSCAIQANRTVACWGLDVFGETKPPSGEFIAVSVDAYYSCGLRIDGTIACWGLANRVAPILPPAFSKQCLQGDFTLVAYVAMTP